MTYLLAWGLYLAMALLLVLGVERLLLRRIGNAPVRVLLRSVVCVGLFTPGLANSEEGAYLVPAWIEVLFNLLARSGTGMMKAALPLLLAGTVVFALLFVAAALRGGRATPAAEE